jgi:hypothetical protein
MPVQHTEFPTRARRNDRYGHMVVQQLLEFLRDNYDRFAGSFVQGSTTVPQGATTIVVTHGLGAAIYVATASPTVNPGGNWWISNKTATTFQLNLAAAAPLGGVPFQWQVKGG